MIILSTGTIQTVLELCISIRKNRDSPAQFQVGCIHLTKPDEIANAFSKHFQSVLNNTPSGVLQLPFTLRSDTLDVVFVND
jgi:hypothetical protein